MRTRAWLAYALFIAACTDAGNSDITSSVATCALATDASVCTAPPSSIAASADPDAAPVVVAGVTYTIGGPNHGYVVFTPSVTGTYTLYFGHDEPARVCDLDAACKANVADCGGFERAAQYAMEVGNHYLIEVHAGANPFLLHIAASAGGSPTVKLAAAQSFAAGVTPYYLTAGDLDGDQVLDLAVSTPDDASGSTTVDLLRGAGTGSFSLVDQVMTSAPAETVVTDVDHDGVADIVGLAVDGQGPLPAFYLHGDGAFAYTTTTWGNGLDFLPRLSGGDFDEDGTLDLVAAYADSSLPTGPAGFVIVAAGSFTVMQDEPAFGHDTRQAIAGDFNGDGHADIIAANRSTGAVRLYAGDGTGTVTAAGDTLLPGGINEVAAFDLDADGADDLVAIHGGTISVSYGGPSGFSAPDVLTMQNAGTRGIAAGDFDHDGQVDLAIGDADAGIVVFLATPTGFENAATLQIPDGWLFTDLAVGDFNGDGYDDLASTALGSVAVFLSTP